MNFSCRNRHDTAQACGDARLTLRVRSPCNDGAVGLEGQRVIPASRYGDNIVETRRHIGLAGVIGAECRYRAIRLEDDGMQDAGRNERLVARGDAALETFWQSIVSEAARRVEHGRRRRLAIGQAVEVEAAAGGSDGDRGRSAGVRQILVVDANPVIVSKRILIHGDLPHRALQGEVSAHGICSDRKQRQHIARAGVQASQRHGLNGAAAGDEIIGEAATGITEIVVIVGCEIAEVCRGELAVDRRVSASDAGEGDPAEGKGTGRSKRVGVGVAILRIKTARRRRGPRHNRPTGGIDLQLDRRCRGELAIPGFDRKSILQASGADRWCPAQLFSGSDQCGSGHDCGPSGASPFLQCAGAGRLDPKRDRVTIDIRLIGRGSDRGVRNFHGLAFRLARDDVDRGERRHIGAWRD